MRRLIRKLWIDDSGQNMIEYALMAALVAVGSAVLLPAIIHGNLSHIFSRVSSCLQRFDSGGC